MADGSPPPSGIAERIQRRLAPGRSAPPPRWLTFAAGIACALGAVTLLSVLTAPRTPPLTQQTVDEAIASALASVTPPPAFSQQVYQLVQPSLVLVEASFGPATVPSAEPPAEPDARPDREPLIELGSGVVVSLDGDILTSLHIVEGAQKVDVTFIDGSKSPADIVAAEPENDIAVLRAVLPPNALYPAILGNPATIQPGSEAYALGSPFGLYGSVTAGIVSALDRTFTLRENDRTIRGLIQIDAAVNPGNSGGALTDRYGRVVGIVTALINPTESETFIGIGLAVPIDVAGGAAGLPPY